MGTKHFKRKELKCKCGCGRADMSPEFMERLELLREEYGKPIILSSAYRCPEYNNKISATGKNGPHTTGRAVDIPIMLYDAFLIAKLAFMFGFTGIGIKQHGYPGKRFIHLDDIQDPRTRPRIWTYGGGKKPCDNILELARLGEIKIKEALNNAQTGLELIQKANRACG